MLLAYSLNIAGKVLKVFASEGEETDRLASFQDMTTDQRVAEVLWYDMVQPTEN